jgi:hypothetical protein
MGLLMAMQRDEEYGDGWDEDCQEEFEDHCSSDRLDIRMFAHCLMSKEEKLQGIPQKGAEMQQERELRVLDNCRCALDMLDLMFEDHFGLADSVSLSEYADK